ncbi:hypothetical protein B9T36_06085 [Acinetobacter sp. ANC 4204]|nr:hypothetical protein B9T36_06085 [Acinetobacter sp. ANC 4204]
MYGKQGILIGQVFHQKKKLCLKLLSIMAYQIYAVQRFQPILKRNVWLYFSQNISPKTFGLT